MKKTLVIIVILFNFSFAYAEYAPYNYFSFDVSYLASIDAPNPYGKKEEKHIIESQINARLGAVDLYMFIDSALDEKYYYGEINPRISLNGLLGLDLSVLFIEEWFLAYNLDFDYVEDFGLLKHYVGLGTNLHIPFFDYFKLNLYAKYSEKNYGRSDGEWDGYLLNSAYAITFFHLDNGMSLRLSGWLDFVFDADKAPNTHQTSNSLQWKNGLSFYLFKFLAINYSYQVNLFYSELNQNTSNSNTHSFGLVLSFKF